ncbi:hypothetical protein PR202_gb12202 [Eleusine coracana subsp. coracana]|uniref:BTB domain-containing protein n=1 Tax=Eleusine coracana subsp. coracana TaxID=191504 RepID=A0AAV5EPT4_ELECO|nr:hypothetical protein PR202_gb12202 [Eleusine coracana subsp. coracana]
MSVFAMYDRYTIRCDLAVSLPHQVKTEVATGAPPRSHNNPPGTSAVMVARPRKLSGLHADLGSLLETMEGADVKFEVCGRLFAAHKVVLAARSSVFKGGFLRPEEGEEHKLHPHL